MLLFLKSLAIGSNVVAAANLQSDSQGRFVRLHLYSIIFHQIVSSDVNAEIVLSFCYECYNHPENSTTKYISLYQSSTVYNVQRNTVTTAANYKKTTLQCNFNYTQQISVLNTLLPLIANDHSYIIYTKITIAVNARISCQEGFEIIIIIIYQVHFRPLYNQFKPTDRSKVATAASIPMCMSSCLLYFLSL